MTYYQVVFVMNFENGSISFNRSELFVSIEDCEKWINFRKQFDVNFKRFASDIKINKIYPMNFEQYLEQPFMFDFYKSSTKMLSAVPYNEDGLDLPF